MSLASFYIGLVLEKRVSFTSVHISLQAAIINKMQEQMSKCGDNVATRIWMDGW